MPFRPIQANRSAPCTQVNLNSTTDRWKIAQVSMQIQLALNNSNGFPCFGDFVSFRSFRFGGFVSLFWVLYSCPRKTQGMHEQLAVSFSSACLINICF